MVDLLYYGTVEDGDEYFAQRLRSTTWTGAEDADKLKALKEATQRIDLLAFKGSKTDEDQGLQMPRDGDEDVPVQVEQATYELALVLLDDMDPDAEARNLGVTSESYSSVRTTYDRSLLDEGTAAGIPSRLAWLLLKPFLRDSGEITLSRVS